MNKTSLLSRFVRIAARSPGFDDRSGGCPDLNSHLTSYYVGQRGLTETGWAVEEDVIDGFSSGGSGFDKNGEILLYSYLSDIVG